MKKSSLWVLILGVLLLIAIGYITFDLINQSVVDKQIAIYNTGAQYGYETAIYQIAQQVATCKIVPLNIENQSIEIIAYDCLQQATG